MKKQLQGIALILFGILLIFGEVSLNDYITHSIEVPWSILGVVAGIIGIIFVFLKDKKDNNQ
jgi:drug/metabolite transporter (DMT)-like permease